MYPGNRTTKLKLLQFVRLLMVVASWLTMVPSSHASSSSTHTDAIKLSRSKLYRFRQRFRDQQLNQRLPSLKKQTTTKSATKGSSWTFQIPTRESVRSYGGTGSSGAMPPPFNHECAGMTNPCLHIGIDDGCSSSSRVIPVSSSTTRHNPEQSSSVDEAWWPQTAVPLSELQGWRILRLRKRLGQHEDCYQRVRDAALNWEFQGDSEGVVRITPAAQQQPSRHIEGRGYAVVPVENVLQQCASDQCLQIWSGPGRRFVTYTKAGLRYTPHLYTTSPVSVVYDLVDQRGPGTTYSSTAFATTQGHWMRGEERVTVALRDNGHVDVEILSLSKPEAHAWGRFIWPFIGRMQRNFFQQQLKSLEKVAEHKSPFIPVVTSGTEAT